ncbi:hypothetical protein EHV15_33080 [Paenibacillus oralis]|uniref:ATP-dependent helicase C-terminal domain-containing protein n=1 Tax=Paenibacillus oralis TaxID=2490856 RepID=A0A3P3UAR3_9BACL|nr:helicase C-terminal domain-containing protein [Paenibacillus oralis]RRJ67224.1 hypothetical protein EHV15_33080 [Paenibacillus oralis]
MPIDFSQFLKTSDKTRETHPIKLYDSLSRSGGMNDLWRGQYLALEEWNEIRTQPNISTNLNTGGGKTAIGLLQGQSLVNETRGRILYLCGSIQLIQQTADAASSMGMKAATYYRGNLVNEAEFNMGDVQCLTTYQALFNGLSRLARKPIRGLLFDDAHVASSIIRENFTLHLKRNEFPDTYKLITNLSRSYFKEVYRNETFEVVVDDETDPSVLFVPLFIWNQIYEQVADVLKEEGVASREKDTRYAWEHLKDNLDLCSLFITSNSIEITPFLPPVHELAFMNDTTRKVFLSATVQDKAEFIRTFGFEPGTTISPKTRAGETERFIVTPYMNKNITSEQWFDHIIQYSLNRKVLIIPTSDKRAQKWRKYEMAFSSDDFTDRVNEFKAAKNGILVAPARFEGMDFPNDTCRTLVIDGLPAGSGHLEKFMWSALGETKALQGTIASRVVQSLGRISRGNDDHGIVFLMGNDLAEWITLSENRERLPKFIRAQLDLGQRITASLTSVEDLLAYETAVFSREDGWLKLHEQEVKDNSVVFQSDVDSTADNALLPVTIALSERKFIRFFWNREYEKAARSLEEISGQVGAYDKTLSGWHLHWIGYCYLKSGNVGAANHYFGRAAGCSKSIGALPNFEKPAKPSPIIIEKESQVGRIVATLSARGDLNYGSISQMDERLQPLKNWTSVSAPQYEEAVRWLGEYLGFQSSRPDKSEGTGPDILWISHEYVISHESKVGKDKSPTYSKSEIGQSYNHLGWIAERFQSQEIQNKFMIISSVTKVHFAASPSKEMNVWLPEEVVTIAEKIRSLFHDVLLESTPSTFYSILERRLLESKLTIKDIFDMLPIRPVTKDEQ